MILASKPKRCKLCNTALNKQLPLPKVEFILIEGISQSGICAGAGAGTGAGTGAGAGAGATGKCRL